MPTNMMKSVDSDANNVRYLRLDRGVEKCMKISTILYSLTYYKLGKQVYSNTCKVRYLYFLN